MIQYYLEWMLWVAACELEDREWAFPDPDDPGPYWEVATRAVDYMAERVPDSWDLSRPDTEPSA